MIQPIHTAVKGRARFRVAGLRGSATLEQYLTGKLAQSDNILRVSSSASTGTVLVQFNSGNTYRTIASLIESIVLEFRTLSVAWDHPGLRHLPQNEQEAQQVALLPGPAVRSGIPLERSVDPSLPAVADETSPWHGLEAAQVLAGLDVNSTAGLSSETAGERLGQYGPNALPESAERSKWSIFIDQFKSLPVALLGAAAVISVATGGLADALVIVGVVGLNGVIGYVTENEAETTINSLKNLVRPCADVLRDGAIKTIAAEQIVPGDILVLRPGNYVAADGRLLEAGHLSIDESALTGESMPVVKTPEAIAGSNVPLGDRINMVYMGTVVTGGQGYAVVVATGKGTEVGRLQTLVGAASSPETPMERQLNQLGNQLVLISGVACGAVFAIGLLRGFGFLEMLKTSISLAVAAVPEGLPTIATTTLALGIRNMRKHHVLIRHLNAVETLGAMQTICFDKTGTITENRMAVVSIHTGMKSIRVTNGRFSTEEGTIDPLACEELLRLIQASVLCNETEVEIQDGEFILTGSPTENAFIHLAIDSSVDVISLRKQYSLLKINYRSEHRLFMGSLHEFDLQGKRSVLIALKGSPIEVLAMCDAYVSHGERRSLTDEDRQRIELANERMAADALRVLGVAYAIVENEVGSELESGFQWLGLIGMADPVRPGVKESVTRFHDAGIDTIMITGDQSATAYAIGTELDLSRGEPIEILDSTHLASIDSATMKAISSKVHVFARVSPAHKLQIVQALQSKGRVVAMTGDGINDGPALKAADIGIAMGSAGTDMAREVADVVLEEDDIETVIIAVRDGRTIYNNIRKSLHFLLATNFSEIMVMLLTVSAGLSSPFNAMQLLWINLISDVFPGLALAMEPPEPDVLQRPPRPHDEPIVKASDFKRLTFESATLSTGAMAAYGYGILKYGMGPQAGTLAFHSLTLGQLLHALSCRSETHSLFSREKLPPNRYLTFALGGSLAVQLLTMVVPGLRGLLGITPIGIVDGMVIGGGALLPLLVNEATKKAA